MVNTITNQNLILPGGTAKIGSFEYQVDMNGAPVTVTDLNNLPIKSVGDSTIYIHDVGDRARRISAADEYRARGRFAVGADVGAEVGRCFDARHH